MKTKPLLSFALSSMATVDWQNLAKDRKRLISTGLLVSCVGLFLWLAAQSYFAVDGLTWLGIILFPYVLIVRHKGVFSLRYGILAGILVLLSLCIPTRTAQFALLTITILFWVEAFVGKTTLLPLAWLVVLSPFFRYVSTVFSFPIRLQLSSWAGSLLSACGFPVKVLGNAIQMGDTEFSVDVACMGLQMIELSLLLSLFLVAHYERTFHKQLHWLWLVGIAGCTLLLNTLSNLLRIILLIVFHILPENPMHDGVGLACLVVYVIVPMAVGIRWLYQSQGRSIQIVSSQNQKPPYRLAVGLGALVLGIVFTQALLLPKPVTPSPSIAVNSLPGFTKQVTTDGIVQLTGASQLIYIKPIAAFYVAEHSPLICWRGSGYNFTQVAKQKIHGMEVYTGILQKGKERIYTAWWFDNGTHRTIDQWEWRWQMLRGEKNFNLVNVNVSRKEELTSVVQTAFQQKML